MEIRTGHTSDLDPATLTSARALFDRAFEGTFTDDDWDHGLGGLHVIAYEGDALVGHASIVQRRLLHLGRWWRVGYVESVCVSPDRQRLGIAGQMMERVERVVDGAYEFGALAATDGAVSLYLGRGWVPWRGATWALTRSGPERTPDDDSGIYVWPQVDGLDIDGELTCDPRGGDPW